VLVTKNAPGCITTGLNTMWSKPLTRELRIIHMFLVSKELRAFTKISIQFCLKVSRHFILIGGLMLTVKCNILLSLSHEASKKIIFGS